MKRLKPLGGDQGATALVTPCEPAEKAPRRTPANPQNQELMKAIDLSLYVVGLFAICKINSMLLQFDYVNDMPFSLYVTLIKESLRILFH